MPEPQERRKLEEKPEPVKDYKFVCPAFDKWKCMKEKAHECSEGYYPVCGESYSGYKFHITKTEEQCQAKCDEDKIISVLKNRKCWGYAWSSNSGGCNLYYT